MQDTNNAEQVIHAAANSAGITTILEAGWSSGNGLVLEEIGAKRGLVESAENVKTPPM